MVIFYWAEQNPVYGNVSSFIYQQSDDDRLNLMKLIKFTNERGGKENVLYV